MIIKKHRLISFMAALLMLLTVITVCHGDEIVFKDKNAPLIGDIVEEDSQSVTIRFPLSVIRSIISSGSEKKSFPVSKVFVEKQGEYFLLKIPGDMFRFAPAGDKTGIEIKKQEPIAKDYTEINKKIDNLEQKIEKFEKASLSPAYSGRKEIVDKLIEEEMGQLEGIIKWKGNPLKYRPVKIVMEKYTGFSASSLKKIFSGDKNASTKDGLILKTTTDSSGRYSFSKVPPGYYHLSWEPDFATGWVHRLSDNPDFEISSGKMTVFNIPEKTR